LPQQAARAFLVESCDNASKQMQQSSSSSFSRRTNHSEHAGKNDVEEVEEEEVALSPKHPNNEFGKFSRPGAT